MVAIRHAGSMNSVNLMGNKNLSNIAIGTGIRFSSIQGGESDGAYVTIESQAANFYPLSAVFDLMTIVVDRLDNDGAITATTQVQTVAGNQSITIPALTNGTFQDLVNRDVVTALDGYSILWDNTLGTPLATGRVSTSFRCVFA